MNVYHKTILIVEDDENDQMLIKKAFRDNGVTSPIHAVNSGSEAIAYLMGDGDYSNRKQFAFPTFIITDLKMPHGDGLTVLEHIKCNPDWASVPTVVFTASEDADDIKKSYMLGASSYHVKPQGYQALRRQLKLLHDYWMTCQVPDVDVTGRQLKTQSKGKLGERFPQSEEAEQKRKKAW
jgi:CheY-like chemotaxis protein